MKNKIIILAAVTVGIGYILGSAVTAAIAIEHYNGIYYDGVKDGKKLQELDALAKKLYENQKDRFSKEKEEA